MNEKNYIRFRKLKAKLNSICFYIMRVFPVDKKLVSVCTFEGKGGFGCNPKYIVQELHRQRPDLKIVWFVNDMSKKFPSYIGKVPNTLLSRAYWLSRSKVWIDNYRKPYGTVKRKGQYYLNTNHYTIGIKTVGLWRGEGFSKMAYLVSKNDSDMIDDLIIDSKFCEVMCPKGLLYNGHMLKTGAPRCDVLYGNRDRIRIRYRKKIGLSTDAKILMFAPTFREGAKDGKRYVYSEKWTIDFARLINNFEKKFGGKWYICIRVHPQLAASFNDYKNASVQDRIINESQADDFYELLAAMDAYITDYSSACFEAGFARMPVFIYADDIEEYRHDRGALFWDFLSSSEGEVSINHDIFPSMNIGFPFSISATNKELEENIMNFDSSKYYSILELFDEKMDLIFNGNASKIIAKKVMEKQCKMFLN